MDSGQCLFAGCNHEEKIKIETGTLHNITNSEHQHI